MMKKLLLTTRGGHFLWSNYKQSPTRWSLSRPPNWDNFLAFSSHHISFATVSIKINKSVGKSNIQRRGWSGAAPAPSDKPNTVKSRKRVSKEERRSMVKSYVMKYREMNAGKFPALSDTAKQVGGNFYVVRKILQELQYESKMSSSNIMSHNLAEKELFNKSKPLTERVTVSSGKTETTIDGHVQNDLQLVDLDNKEIVNAGYEDRRRPHSRSLSDEDVTTTVSGSHSIAAEGIVRDAEEPALSSLKMLNGVKTAEAESGYSDSVAARNHLLTERREHSSAPFSEQYGSTRGKAQNDGSEYVDMESVADEPCKSSLQMSSVKTEEVVSSCSNSFASESHPLTQEMEQVSVPFSEKSGNNNHEVQIHDPEYVHMERDTEEPSQSGLKISNEVKARSDMLAEELEHIPTPFSDKSGSSPGKTQSRNYEFADVENHLVTDKKFIEKVEYERRDQAALEGLPGTDNPKHKMEHSQGSSVLDENKSDKSNNEATDLVAPKKSTYLGILKSFADGVVNFWRNL